MDMAVIQRQYDDVIAPHYDQDPQDLMAMSLDRVIHDLNETGLLYASPDALPLRVLDLGMGTGTFLSQLQQQSGRQIEPHGMDLSEGMVRIAESKIPGLQPKIGDAAEFNKHYAAQTFDVICTHFMTGFVPVETLAPSIFTSLAPGGVWSFVGSSALAYPTLRETANNWLIRAIFGGQPLSFDDMIVPANEGELLDCIRKAGFEVVCSGPFEPELCFPDMSSFMEFAYSGGWLTPYVEALGLQKAGRAAHAVLNRCVFPLRDHHHILLALAKRPPE